MDIEREIKISKLLSFVLRHHPEEIGLTMDENGWVNICELLTKVEKKNFFFSMSELEHVVNANAKQRFIFNDDKTKIRASQGHSIKVDLELEEKEPPAFLYHGTVAKFLGKITIQGLKKMDRQHVHLSKDQLRSDEVHQLYLLSKLVKCIRMDLNFTSLQIMFG